ncbi:hypothetical protein BLNAU_15946 [Blattamonas nauphoetae]|uniref:Uncharacterized protein n=1 Tax=Blattamonas nauphoetae TaxID=2049346 RepID=A0ABQ9XFZ1_9EUKA|nr:hypothetical protein BLNAU_15946 [Blattamonas nauphoetae]
MKEIGHFMSLVEGKQDKGRDLQNAIEAESARFDKSRISPSFIQGNDDADITSIHSLPLSPSALTHPLDDPTEELTKRSHHSPRSGQSTQTREAGEHDDFTSPATTRRSQKSTTRSHPATPVHPRTADSQSVVSSKTKKRMVTTETVGSLKITTTRPNSHQKTETVTRRPTTRPQTACGFGVNLRRDDNEKEETNNKHKSPRSRSAQPNTSQPNYSNNVEPTPTPTLPLHVLRNDDVGVFLSNTTPFQSLPKIDTQSSPSPTGQTTRKRNIEVSQLKERSSAQNASQNGLKNRTAFEKSSEKMTSQDVEPTDIPLYSVPKIPTLPP